MTFDALNLAACLWYADDHDEYLPIRFSTKTKAPIEIPTMPNCGTLETTVKNCVDLCKRRKYKDAIFKILKGKDGYEQKGVFLRIMKTTDGYDAGWNVDGKIQQTSF